MTFYTAAVGKLANKLITIFEKREANKPLQRNKYTKGFLNIVWIWT
jgi:hypothetical protein